MYVTSFSVLVVYVAKHRDIMKCMVSDSASRIVVDRALDLRLEACLFAHRRRLLDIVGVLDVVRSVEGSVVRQDRLGKTRFRRGIQSGRNVVHDGRHGKLQIY